MRAVVWIVALSACGRIGFDPVGAGDGGDGGGTTGDGPVNLGPGPRWVRELSPGTGDDPIAGANNEVVVATTFASSLTIDGAVLQGMASVRSSGAVRYTATGAIRWTTVLDAASTCEIFGLAMRGDDALAVGLTSGPASSALGPCSAASGGAPDPIEVRIDASGMQHSLGHWINTGASTAEGSETSVFGNGTVAMSGSYGTTLTIGAPLPMAGLVPNGFITRFADDAVTAQWTRPLNGGVHVYGGPVSADADEVCAMGAFDGPVSLLGQALPHVGGLDVWFARLDSGGAPRYVRALGSAGDELAFHAGSTTHLAGSGCVSSFTAPADLMIDSTLLPASQGEGVLLGLDGGGSTIIGVRIPHAAQVLFVNGKTYGAFDVSVPYSVGGTMYTPTGSDVIICEIGNSGPTRLVGSIGGAGEQHIDHFTSIAIDAVAMSVTSTGELTFGTSRIDTGATTIRAIAVLGL